MDFISVPVKTILAVVGIAVVWMTIAYGKQNEKTEIHNHNE